MAMELVQRPRKNTLERSSSDSAAAPPKTAASAGGGSGSSGEERGAPSPTSSFRRRASRSRSPGKSIWNPGHFFFFNLTHIYLHVLQVALWLPRFQTMVPTPRPSELLSPGTNSPILSRADLRVSTQLLQERGGGDWDLAAGVQPGSTLEARGICRRQEGSCPRLLCTGNQSNMGFFNSGNKSPSRRK